jgi:hypothetical protein
MELDVERPQVGVEASILDRHHIGIRPGFIDVFVPISRRSNERRTLHSIDANRISDASIFIQMRTNKRVDSKVRVNNKVQGDRLMTVRKLSRARRYDAEHRP